MDIVRAAQLIREGELVAIPTETVYGLAGNALDPQAAARIYAAKGRPATSPLIVHVGSIAMARSLAAEWSPLADRLAHTYWPGPLTLVVPKADSIPDIVTAGLPTVGLRMPSHPIALALIRESGVPLAAPSANLFTGLSPTTADHVRQALGASIAMVLDGGPCVVGIESTVVSVAGPPMLLRPGMISREQIEAVTGPLADPAQPGMGAHPAPGMHPRHYSPRTRLILGPPPSEGRGAWVTHSAAGGTIQLPPDPKEYAVRLYSTLHSLDQQGLDWIAVEPPPDGPGWAPVIDRLRRAASP
ncbi:MAG: threonylcarbamoyl-AMP synthase [Acidobacteria bacterium]|nr:threonylcarbamoyl-AMP synthase [Acidobacteriota bacterium]